MATYTAVAVARTPNQSTGPTLVELGPLVGSVSFTEVLNEGASATVAVSVNSLDEDIKQRLRDPVGYAMEVAIYRDGVPVFAGPLLGGEVLDDVVTLHFGGLEVYTAFMLITTDKSWTSTDLATIAVEVIDDWQTQDYGDFGIETATVGTIGNTLTQALPGADEPLTVFEFLMENAGSDNGFDWAVNPDTRELEVWASRGSDLSASVFLERGVTSAAIRFAASPGTVASEVRAIGTGPDIDTPLATTKTNTAVRASFGKAGVVIESDPVNDASHLGDIAQAFLDERDSVFFVPGPALIPVTGAGVMDFGVGDLVTYTFDAGLGQVTGTYRVNKKTVTVADTGQETMSVEFA